MLPILALSHSLLSVPSPCPSLVTMAPLDDKLLWHSGLLSLSSELNLGHRVVAGFLCVPWTELRDSLSAQNVKAFIDSTHALSARSIRMHLPTRRRRIADGSEYKDTV